MIWTMSLHTPQTFSFHLLKWLLAFSYYWSLMLSYDTTINAAGLGSRTYWHYELSKFKHFFRRFHKNWVTRCQLGHLQRVQRPQLHMRTHHQSLTYIPWLLTAGSIQAKSLNIPIINFQAGLKHLRQAADSKLGCNFLCPNLTTSQFILM